MDCSLPGSSVHGIFQVRELEWVAISFSGGSSWPRDQTQVSHIAGRHFAIWATMKVLMDLSITVLEGSEESDQEVATKATDSFQYMAKKHHNIVK